MGREPTWRGDAHRVLPRFFERSLKVENAVRVAAAPPPADETEHGRFRGDALLVDRERLRGLPAIGRGVSGAIAGTDPFRAAAARERDRERDRGAGGA